MIRRNGVVAARVEDVKDPQGEGRVRVSFPWLGGQCEGYWAPVATLMSGGGRGAWFMPEKGDEVLVAFDQGDVEHPFIVGFLHNGEQRPPENDPQVRMIHSVNGHKIVLRDPDVQDGDTGGIRIEDAHGNVVELGNARISITSVGMIEIKAPTVVINGRPVSLAPSII